MNSLVEFETCYDIGLMCVRSFKFQGEHEHLISTLFYV